MKGGFNNPPNYSRRRRPADRRYASMKGGFNNPPNRLPPAGPRWSGWGFNEGGVQ